MDRIERNILLGLAIGIAILVAALLAEPRIFLPTVKDIEPFPKDRVPTVRIVMPQASWQRLISNPMAEQYVRAEFWFDGQRYPNVAVRPKGNSSLRSAAAEGTGRLGFKIDFNILNKAQSFCGVKKLNLNNGWSDPTLIREVLAYELFGHMGIPVPRTALVDLWVNDRHLGLYTQVEQIDQTFLARYFANPNGNLYKPEMIAAGLNWTQEDTSVQAPGASRQEKPDLLQVNLGGSRLAELLAVFEEQAPLPGPGRFQIPAGPAWPPGGQGWPVAVFAGVGPPPMGPMPDPAGPGGPVSFMPGPPPPRMGFGPGQGFGPGRGPLISGRSLLELAGLKTNEDFAHYQGLFGLLEVLNRCPDDEFPASISQIFDVDQLLRYLAVSVAIVHLDNYIGMGHNYYLYESQGRFTILPWDLNMAFGTFSMGSPTQDPAEYPIDQPAVLTDRPLVARVLAHEPFLDKYHQYLREIVDRYMASGLLQSRIDQLATLVRPFISDEQVKGFEMALDQGQATVRGGLVGPGPDMGRPGPPMFVPSLGTGPGRLDPNRPMPGPPGMMGRRGGPMGGPPGMNAPGLKAFIARRTESIQRQLAAQVPTKAQIWPSRRPGSLQERPGI